MTDTTEKSPTTPRKAGPRQHHVAAHINDDWVTTTGPDNAQLYDDIVVFGTEIEALRHIVGKPGWVYKALANGQAFGEAGS